MFSINLSCLISNFRCRGIFYTGIAHPSRIDLFLLLPYILRGIQYHVMPVSRGIRFPLKVIWGDQLIYPSGPQYTIRNDPLKLRIDTKHRLLMLNTCNVDEYFQNTAADLHHIHVSSQASRGPRATDLNHNLKT